MQYSDFFTDNESFNSSQDVFSLEPTPPADNLHNADSSEPVYGNPEDVVADFPMPYYSYPTLGGPVSEEYASPFESSPHINYTLLNDANFMLQDPSTVVYSHTLEAEPGPTVKMEIDPPCEGLGLLTSWDSFMGIPSLRMGTAHGHLLPSSLLSDPISSLSGLDTMAGPSRSIFGAVDSEKIYNTYSPALDQQSERKTDEDEDGKDDDEGDFVTIMMMRDQMEVKEEEGMDNDPDVKVEQDEAVQPIDFLRQQLLEDRIRDQAVNWGPYGPCGEYMAVMRNYIRALENRLLLSRAGWSSHLLEELFGSHLLYGQWPPPPPPPPPSSN